MTHCLECGGEIANNQEKCPDCGMVQAALAPADDSANASAHDNAEWIESGWAASLLDEDHVADAVGPTETADDAPETFEVDADEHPVHMPEIVAAGGTSPALNETARPVGRETDSKKAGLKPLSEGILLNDRYRIVRKIGGGGMGAVYLAQDQNLGGIERAVKEMVQSSIEEEQQKKAIEDFRRESTILTTLDHPSIPTIYDFFFDEPEGRFYLVMKYISGGDLAARLRSSPAGRIDEKTVAEWALQITDVLAYLHSLPTTVVYRDLKPST